MAGSRNTIGIDVGTTSVKAAVIDGSGHVLARFAERYATDRPAPGLSEQDPRHWTRLIDAALESFADYEVAAIGLTSQVNTHVFVDANMAPLAPAITWQDVRAGQQAAALDAKVTPAQKQAWWGAPMPIDASNVLSRMAWMAETHPQVWDATRHVMLPKDVCLHHLTERAVTDPLSNIGLVDQSLEYLPGALDLVPGASDRVVPLTRPSEIIGEVVQGAHAGIPVVCATMDAWTALAGAGGAAEGSTIYLSGTSEILGISSQGVIPTPGVIVFAECDGVRLHAAPTQAGGDAALWFAESQGLSLEQMTEAVAASPRSTATPLFLPQLAGERAPLWNPDLRGAFLGISRATTGADFARSVYEGVAMGARMALEALRASADEAAGPVICGGGGFLSAPWTQIRADVLGVPMHVLATQDPGVLGAAALAAHGVGQYGSLQEATGALARIDRIVEPDPSATGGYDALFDLYREAIEVNASLGHRITSL